MSHRNRRAQFIAQKMQERNPPPTPQPVVPVRHVVDDDGDDYQDMLLRTQIQDLHHLAWRTELGLNLHKQ